MSQRAASAAKIGSGLSSRQTALLWMLAVAADEKMSLVDEIDALAADSSGGQRKRLRDLADMLRAGIPMPEAVENIRGLIPRQARFAIRVGCETDQLGPALRSAAENLAGADDDANPSNKMYVVYCAGALYAAFSICMFLLYYIIPKYAKIFADFNVELPAATLLIINASDVLVSFLYLFLPLFSMLILALAGFAVISMFGGFRNIAIPDFIVRRFPRLETPHILRNLALVVEAGKPMAKAVSLAAYFYPRPLIRQKLAQIEVAIQHADDCYDQLRYHKLITRSEEQLLRSAEHTGNLGWAMRNIADNLDRRLRYRARLLMEFIKPLAIIVLAGIVCLFALAFFMPLITLIDQLSIFIPV